MAKVSGIEEQMRNMMRTFAVVISIGTPCSVPAAHPSSLLGAAIPALVCVVVVFVGLRCIVRGIRQCGWALTWVSVDADGRG